MTRVCGFFRTGMLIQDSYLTLWFCADHEIGYLMINIGYIYDE